MALEPNLLTGDRMPVISEAKTVMRHTLNVGKTTLVVLYVDDFTVVLPDGVVENGYAYEGIHPLEDVADWWFTDSQ